VITTAPRCGIPAGAQALSVNVTAVSPPALGHLRLFPGDAATPNVATLNFVPGVTRANNAVVRLASSGSATLGIANFSAASVHVVIDVNGYFE
jgi:hypothetical protein